MKGVQPPLVLTVAEYGDWSVPFGRLVVVMDTVAAKPGKDARANRAGRRKDFMYPCCRGAGIRDRFEKGGTLWNQRFQNRGGICEGERRCHDNATLRCCATIAQVPAECRDPFGFAQGRLCAAKDAAQDDNAFWRCRRPSY